ncbi:YutD family protein [Streptococcus panodentis]|uniref:DUF1027 domain-containing protein n=1 Tax=Streptococcus panodentis TaxID=1581472 RepID=A0ABS5AZ57_9STRE|nr:MULTISPECIES: YutD-like domain-containing protein [Streptococcus]KXT81531.1 hypothetical protein STRDD11_02011 [Streptococcus sp. DD11]MBP2621528.1 DUF1027 domain-containing protein [Streptococcus panodentis]
MRKEISPELYNYNRFPGPEFRQIGSKIAADQFEFDLVENHKGGFDLTAFHQRFSEILTKFDYIVGDWGNEQLRLRGFYKDERAQESSEKISRLEDYLLEYCSYGCAYFVLENPHPQRASFDKKSHGKKEGDGKSKRSRSNRSNSSRDRRNERDRFDRDFKRSSRRSNKQNRQNKQHPQQKQKDSSRHFVIRQK